jgi:hypothetical protein
MKREFPDLPTWDFEMDEVSAGVYEVTGRDLAGHRVSAKGIALDNLMEQCRREALRIMISGSSAKKQ